MLNKNQDLEFTRIIRRSGCASSHLRQFIDEQLAVGYSFFTVELHARGIAHLGRWADKRRIPIKSFDDEVIEKFRKHLKNCRCSPNSRQNLKPARIASGYFLDLLRRKRIVCCAPIQERKIPLFIRFEEWLRIHRGLAAETIKGYEIALRPFFKEMGQDPRLWSPSWLRAFVAAQAKTRGVWEIKRLCNATRALLKFLAMEGKCPDGWETAIPTIPQWKLSSLPRFLEPRDVERVIRKCEVSTVHGLRDRAIILLLARLGLRARDVIDMKLEDIDWTNGILRLLGKMRREELLPLPQEVGNALLSYLKHRPKVDVKNVFICLNAPYRPFKTSASIADIVRVALERAQIKDPPSWGAHLLRHSAATAMLRSGSTFDAVAKILRHQSTDTTAHYAKIDVKTLKTIAQPWPKGDLC